MVRDCGTMTTDLLQQRGAQDFPLMLVLSIVYPCNFGCPNCPYSDGNSEIRKFYREKKGDLFPFSLWKRIADEAAPFKAFLRCTGGGEPMLHPRLVEMIEYAKAKGARVWLNTNGSRLGPDREGRERLRRIIATGIDLIEFSMDAGDAETYSKLRPPIGGPPKDPKLWFEQHLSNVKAALILRRELKVPTRVVVSLIRQESIADRIDQYVDFYANEVQVDEVITRKFLNWDDNTEIDLARALDKDLYADLPAERKEPCVWPFERLNIDTLGRVTLCGQDISFRMAEQFPNLHDSTIQDIWKGSTFNRYRKLHLEGRGAEVSPCRGCSAWFAGVRDWNYGWLQVLKKSGEHLNEVMQRDFGSDVQIVSPNSLD